MVKPVVPMDKPTTPAKSTASTFGKQQAAQAMSKSFYIPKGSSNADLADAVLRDSRAEHAEIAVLSIRPNPRQPRTYIDPVKLQELAASIDKDGLIEEIVVRRSLTEEDIFDIICGERRWRACSELLHWTHIPSTIRVATDAEMLRIAIIENEQRQQLSPLELAVGYQQLYDMVDEVTGKRIYSYRTLAAEVGKDKDHVQQHLKLVSAPQALKDLMLEDSSITVRIINELLDVEDPSDLDYLMEGVRQHRYKNPDIIFLVGQLKKERALAKANVALASVVTQETASMQSSITARDPVADAQETVSNQSAVTTDALTDVQEITSSEEERVPVGEVQQSAILPSPELALADRKRMLSKDGGQVEKIVKRYKIDRSSMNEMEQQAVREAVQQWIESLQDLLK